jgi:hypothetical protein
VGFTTTLANLGPNANTCTGATGATSTGACLIDNVLGKGTKSGYTFALAAGSGGVSTPQYTFGVNANPVTAGTSGQRSFYSDQTGVIRYNQSTTASSTDSPLQ